MSLVETPTPNAALALLAKAEASRQRRDWRAAALTLGAILRQAPPAIRLPAPTVPAKPKASVKLTKSKRQAILAQYGSNGAKWGASARLPQPTTPPASWVLQDRIHNQVAAERFAKVLVLPFSAIERERARSMGDNWEPLANELARADYAKWRRENPKAF